MAGEARRRRLRALLDLAHVSDDALDAVDQAFVHESAAKEELVLSNERLEFLGDAVLGVVVARWLYATYPHEKEGMLAKRKAAIVSDSAIARTAAQLGFSDLIRVGAGERAHGGASRVSILADAFEAFVAALYLNYGFDAAQRFVELRHIATLDHSAAALPDAKTQLQELTQARLACTPDYTERGEGPAHERIFTSVVRVNGEALGTGTGPSKKAAQQNAAAQALEILQNRFL
jgi:ribonuclease III